MTQVPASSHGAAESPVLTASVTLSSAQLLALKATPVTLVAAPGAGKLLNFESFSYVYTAGATPYTTGSSQLEIVYAGSSVVLLVLNSGALGNAASQVGAEHEGQGAPVPLTEAVNKAFTLRVNPATDALLNGDGTYTVASYYTVLTP